MKKLLGLLTFFAMVNIAGAAVLKVVPVDVGQSEGRLGGMSDVLLESDTIGLAIVLEYNPYYYEGTHYPDYDGYLLSSIDLDLEVAGPGTLDVVMKEDPPGAPPQEDLGVHSNFGLFSWSSISENSIAYMTGTAMPAIGPPAEGQTIDVIWNLLLHCDGEGQVVIDLTLHGLTQYSEYGDYYEAWVDAIEEDLGDLVIYQVPEPMTVALLGLGGLFLLRRRR